MMKKMLLFIVWLHSCIGLQAQYISLDTSGRVDKITLAANNDATLNVKIDGAITDDFLREKLKTFFREKLDSTIDHLSSRRLIYQPYYNQAMPGAIGPLVKDLKAIRAWIDNSALIPSLTHLQPFFRRLDTLLSSKTADWYRLNGKPFSNSLQLSDRNFDPVANAYIIDLTVNRLFNKFVTDLYNDTYPQSNNKLNALTEATYNGVEKELDSLYKKALLLSKNINDVTKQDYEDITSLHQKFLKNDIVNAIAHASYFKNWIWLRGGSPVINPFEILAKDTVTGKITTPLTRADNVSLVAQTLIPGELLNRISLSKGGIKKERNIHFFRLPDDPTKKQVDEIDAPLRGDENVRINMHNTFAAEKPVLRIVKQEAHSGRNSLIDSISSGLGILATAYASFNPSLAFLTGLFGQVSLEKSMKDTDFPKSKAVNKSVTDTALVQKHLEEDLKAAHNFNPSIFEQIKAKIPAKQPNGSVLQMPTYVTNFIKAYKTMYEQYIAGLETLSSDSLVLANTLPVVTESSLPPDTMVMNRTGITTPFYRTVVLETGKVDKDVTTEYAIRSFFKNSDAQDSTTLATFTVKTANLKRMMASAGLMFTGARASYGQTTFTPGTETAGAVIKTSTKTTSFVVGLNVYFARINMLDEHWFNSKECPYYTRFSLFLGLDIPDVMDHFYPGISFDLNPGIKLTGGPHLYRRTKYSIANNEVKKEANVLSYAGPFIGLNIDTEAIIKVINIFKK
ncbi:hypothetical protein [Chitinophaga sp.]|uniref:hypothetical protein n=1 Tax=Chitinophaga sp. TaxID=1869181 RepID=UPI002F92096F